MSEQLAAWDIIKLIIILGISMLVIKILFTVMGRNSFSGTMSFNANTTRTHPTGAKNWIPCRICKQPINTDSYDIKNWFCVDCQQVRNDLIRGQATTYNSSIVNNTKGKAREVELEELEKSMKQEKKKSSIIEWNEDGSMK